MRSWFIDGLVEGTISKVMTGECSNFRHEGGISSPLLILNTTSILLSNLSLSLLYSIRSFAVSS
jgi:hypothetical protein